MQLKNFNTVAKGNSLRKNMSYDVQIIKFSPPITAHPFTQPPQILCFIMPFNRPHIPKVPLPMGASTPHTIHIPWTHPTPHSKLHLDGFSRVHEAYSRDSYTLQCALKCDQCTMKNINRRD